MLIIANNKSKFHPKFFENVCDVTVTVYFVPVGMFEANVSVTHFHRIITQLEMCPLINTNTVDRNAGRHAIL